MSQRDSFFSRHGLVFVALLIGLSGFIVSVKQISRLPAKPYDPQLYVALPPALQVAVAGGDQYLAANLAVVRAIVASLDKLDEASGQVLGRIQRDAAILNPFHEDNYYLAAATLSWIGQYEAAQFVLQRATEARVHDMLPPFFLGFNYQYFRQDYPKAAEAARIAAERATGSNRVAMTAMTARWLTKGGDTRDALRVLDKQLSQTKDPALKNFLLYRVHRLGILILLEEAHQAYLNKTGVPPTQLSDLLVYLDWEKAGQFDLSAYTLSAAGKPVLAK